MTNGFRVTVHGKKNAPNSPKMRLNIIRLNVHHMYVTRVSESISLYDHLRVTYHSEKSKHDLEQYRGKGSQICVTSVPESYLSMHFALRPALYMFRIACHLRQVHLMPLNDLEYCIRSKVANICVDSPPEFQVSVRLTLRPTFFELQAILKNSSPNFPFNNIEHCKVKDICLSGVPGSQLSLCSQATGHFETDVLI